MTIKRSAIPPVPWLPYLISSERSDPERGKQCCAPLKAADLASAKRLADEQDTWAVVTGPKRGVVLYDNGKSRAPWTEEQIARYEASLLRRMSDEDRKALADTNEAMQRVLLRSRKYR